MGTKIIITALSILSSITVVAQNESIILKKYSLYKCLSTNYKQVDSLFISHDYSASYMFQIQNADYNNLNSLDTFVNKTTSNYYKMDVVENLEDNKANYIFWHCMDFYESKELDNYIRKLIGVTPKKKTSKK